MFLVRVRPRDLRALRRSLPRGALHHGRVSPARASPGVVGARQRAWPVAATVAEGPRRLSRSARVKLLVTGAAGFIGSTYVHLLHGDHDVTVKPAAPVTSSFTRALRDRRRGP